MSGGKGESADGASVVCVGECMLELSGMGEGEELRLGCAGDSLNIAVYMSRIMGPGNVAYASRLGDDPMSSGMVAFIESEGIDAGLIARVAGKLPGLYLISTEQGERTFHYWRSEAPVREMLSEPEPDTEAALAGAGCLVATGITAAVLGAAARGRLAGCMERNGHRVAYVVNHRPKLWDADEAREWHLRFAGLASHLFVSDDDLVLLWSDGSGLERMQGACPGEVVLTEGERGCRVFRGKEEVAQCGSRAAEVVDTTAAGDSFAAAYLAGRIAGRDAAASAGYAAELAATVTSHRGAIIPREGMPAQPD